MNKQDYEGQLIKWLVWGDGFVRKNLVDHFNITPVHASRIITKFKLSYSSHIERQPNGRYIALQSLYDFVSAEEYYGPHKFLQQMLIDSKNSLNPGVKYNLSNLINVAPTLEGHSEPSTIRQVNSAMRDRKSLNIKYIGMNLGDLAQERVIFPLGYFFVYDRWHLHAYCFKRGECRDFVLGRIMEIKGQSHLSCPPKFRGARIKKLVLSPHAMLSEDQRNAVSNEYKILNGKLVIFIPETLVHYAKSRYLGTHLPREQQKPPAILLELVNEDFLDTEF